MTAAVQQLVDQAPRYVAQQDREAPLPFKLVPIADLTHAEPAAPLFAWEGLVPLGVVTNWSAHGGVGKTMVLLMLCVAQALHKPLFGIPTRGGRALFYSGEDSAGRLRFLLKLICRSMGVDVADLEGKLFILDATDHDPTLFTEVTTAGRKEGTTTSTYAALSEFLAGIADLRLVVIDNASDTYDASEIDRARVRGYMRALARIARERNAAVVLLAHVDKGTSRGERSSTEGYSGSTAWHNSARSRIFMRRESDGTLLIEHQKHNLGKLHEPVRLIWPEGGIPQLDQPLGAVVQGIADRGHERALLRLIAEYSARGEHVSTATNSRTHAAKVLRHEASFPARLKDGEVFDLLRKAERSDYLRRMEIRGANRHPRECWELTDAGRTFAHLPALTALTAPTPQVSAPNAEGAEDCADCADFALGGMGEMARAQQSAQ
jgi:putative DNA primase/helicase